MMGLWVGWIMKQGWSVEEVIQAQVLGADVWTSVALDIPGSCWSEGDYTSGLG